jgi:hypothetical protein
MKKKNSLQEVVNEAEETLCEAQDIAAQLARIYCEKFGEIRNVSKKLEFLADYLHLKLKESSSTSVLQVGESGLKRLHEALTDWVEELERIEESSEKDLIELHCCADELSDSHQKLKGLSQEAKGIEEPDFIDVKKLVDTTVICG